VTPDKHEAKKPDVTQPGVLPPPQNMVKPITDPAAQAGPVVQAGATEPAAANAAPPAAAHGPAAPSFSKLASRFERKTPATDMGLGWRNRIAYLPDPARSGAPGPGLVGQLFLFGGSKLEFVDADGTLTVDLIDETPRPAGQPPAKPERWQFNKELLLKMRATDETFGRSYVLFLPWPAYKPDVTRVRVAARYDPEDPKNGHTLYAAPAVITLDTSGPHGAPVWDGHTTTFSAAPGAGGTLPPGALPVARPLSETIGSVPVGLAGAIPLGGPLPGGAREPVRSINLTPPAPQSDPVPILPPSPPTAAPPAGLPLPPSGSPTGVAPSGGSVPPGLAPVAPLPPGLPPLAITIGRP
jgi:hypothetical protein